MSTLAFVLVAIVFAVYALLDGYDLGVGTLMLFVARSSSERASGMAAIGPVWNGNEVWLIAGGGALFALFPQAYASAFSGFYLPFVFMLWLLMVRGIAMELRNHVASELWHAFFDVAFALSSGLLIVLAGIAIGNVVRGVPLDARFDYLGTLSFLFNPYAIGVALLALVSLAQHGAAFLASRVEGEPAKRAGRSMPWMWPVVLAAYLGITVATFDVHSPMRNIAAVPVLAFIPLATFLGLIGVRVAHAFGRARDAFVCSGVFITGLIASAAMTDYPDLLPSYPADSGAVAVFTNPVSPATFATVVSILGAGLIAVLVYRTILVRRLHESDQ